MPEGNLTKTPTKYPEDYTGWGSPVSTPCPNSSRQRYYREGKIWEQTYERGKPLGAGRGRGELRSKWYRSYLSNPIREIFQQVLEYNYDTLAQRMRELSFLNKGITIELTDKRRKDEEGNFVYKKHFTPMKASKNTSAFLDS